MWPWTYRGNSLADRMGEIQSYSTAEEEGENLVIYVRKLDKGSYALFGKK